MSCHKNKLHTALGHHTFTTPIFAASGVWPLERDLWPLQSLEGLGGICSKGITLRPRSGNPGHRIWETPGGLLNSIGLQNPGVEVFARDYLKGPLINTDPSMIVNIAPESEREFPQLFAPLNARMDKITAVELNLSCPNVSAGGMSWGKTPQGVATATELARSQWKGDLWIKLTPQAPNLEEVARAAEKAGADALVVGNTWLGMAMDLEKKRPAFQRVVAGLSGPAIFPLALRTVWAVAGAVTIPVIGCGGISSWEDGAAMLLAGARAIQIGSGLFKDLTLPGKIARGLEEYMKEQGWDSLDSMVGAGREDNQ